MFRSGRGTRFRTRCDCTMGLKIMRFRRQRRKLKTNKRKPQLVLENEKRMSSGTSFSRFTVGNQIFAQKYMITLCRLEQAEIHIFYCQRG